jgi:hypothetical protein
MDIRRIRKLMIVLSLVVIVLVLGACCGPCCEEIAITSPAPGTEITSPVIVMGMATIPFEAAVAVRVWDIDGQQIGLEGGLVTGGEWGQCGVFTVSVPYTEPPGGTPILIQVFTDSPANGQLLHLSSVWARQQ